MRRVPYDGASVVPARSFPSDGRRAGRRRRVVPSRHRLRHAPGALAQALWRRRLAAGLVAAAAAAWLGLAGQAPGEAERRCLALNVYHEARGEPPSGQLAVAHVVLNRVADEQFPDSICEVVHQGGETLRGGCHFSWWCDGRSDEPADRRAWRRSRAVAEQALSGRSVDPTGGALYYHATWVSPYWAAELQRGATIGRHVFYHLP